MKHLLLSSLFVLTSCGVKFTTSIVKYSTPAIQCTTALNGANIDVTCPNGVNYSFPAPTNGRNGNDGSDGKDGTNGHNALIAQNNADSSMCVNKGIVIRSGTDTNDNNILEISETVATAVLCNGIDAKTSPFLPVALLAPCAANPMHPTDAELSNPRLEVFLKFSNGLILESYSDNISGYNTHYGVLSPGTYMSTGASNCTFKYDGVNIIKL